MIRQAEYKDIPVCMELVNGFFAHGELDGTGLEVDQDTIEFAIQDMIDLDNAVVFVAEVDGMVVGSIGGYVFPWSLNANILVLQEKGWFIPPENRMKYPVAALGLKKAFMKWGKEKGATVICMVSTKRDETPRVIQMYEKWGLILMDHNFVGKL